MRNLSYRNGKCQTPAQRGLNVPVLRALIAPHSPETRRKHVQDVLVAHELARGPTELVILPDAHPQGERLQECMELEVF